MYSLQKLVVPASKFIDAGDNVYSCFYDLDSTFDAVEFSVLIEELFGDSSDNVIVTSSVK